MRTKYFVVASIALAGVACLAVTFSDRAAMETAGWQREIVTRYVYDDDSIQSIGVEFRVGDEIFLVVDENQDGIFDEFRVNDSEGIRIRARDRNNDRRLDWWYQRRSSTEARMARDDDFDGVVDSDHSVAIVGP